MVAAVVELPAGSRERAGVVNLVDAAAAAELEGFLSGTVGTLEQSLNLFLTHYVEQYDFVYLFTDHPLETTTTAGRFRPVTQQAMPGTGLDYDFDIPGYRSNGKTRGALAINFTPGGYGPLTHEIMHYWGAFLSRDDFGFGVGLDASYASHWGFAGFRGILGGFDAETLRCETPSGAVPPSCTAESNGRFRYRVGSFNTAGNDVEVLAPLELYLMGLLPASELPETIPVFVNGQRLSETYDSATNTIAVEADGINLVESAAIIAKHGEVRLLPPAERAFSTAFVVISATPATDSVLDEIGERAKNHAGKPANLAFSGPPFPAITGGRATMETTLGPRRAADAPAPPIRVPRSCDLLEQDCRADSTCHYVSFVTTCGLTRGGTRDEPCSLPADCAPGLGCSQNQAGDVRACEPYCNPDPSAANACGTQCPWFYLVDAEDNVLGGLCMVE
jgi:hypothetical protein